jgi:hypothetical protein
MAQGTYAWEHSDTVRETNQMLPLSHNPFEMRSTLPLVPGLEGWCFQKSWFTWLAMACQVVPDSSGCLRCLQSLWPGAGVVQSAGPGAEVWLGRRVAFVHLGRSQPLFLWKSVSLRF